MQEERNIFAYSPYFRLARISDHRTLPATINFSHAGRFVEVAPSETHRHGYSDG